MSGIGVLIVEFVWALALGHAPALLARYTVKKAPLSHWVAVVIALLSAVVLVLAVAAAHETLGLPQLRMTASLVGVSALLSIATMVRGKREHLILGLQAMIADPATTADRRALALDRLEKLNHTAPRPTRHPPDTCGEDSLNRISRKDQTGPQSNRMIAGSGAKRSRLRDYGRPAAYAAGAAIALNVLLMASEYRVLIHQQVLEAGQEYVTDEWVFGSDTRAVIVCQYWTGRSVRPTAMRYGPGPRERDECPLLFDRIEER